MGDLELLLICLSLLMLNSFFSKSVKIYLVVPAVELDKALDESLRYLGRENCLMREDCFLHQSKPLSYRLVLIINNSEESCRIADIINSALG